MNFFKKIQDHYKKKYFPFISFTIFSLLPIIKIKNIIDQKLKILTPSKPCIIFDIEDFLVKKKLTLFGYEYCIRDKADMFLFHLARIYDLISISKLPINIDPYGCIRQRIYTPQKNRIDGDLDLSKTVVISTGDVFHPKFRHNVLAIPKYKDDKYGLMQLLNFLYFLERERDFRSVLRVYRNVPFYEYFGNVDYRMFKMRNILTINPQMQYKKYLKGIDDAREKEYKQAKNIMNVELQKTSRHGFLKSLFNF